MRTKRQFAAAAAKSALMTTSRVINGHSCNKKPICQDREKSCATNQFVLSTMRNSLHKLSLLKVFQVDSANLILLREDHTFSLT